MASRPRETPEGGAQVAHTYNAYLHSYNAQVASDGSLEWSKAHSWARKIRQTDLIRIQAVHANLKLTQEDEINDRNNALGMALQIQRDEDEQWLEFAAPIMIPHGTYETSEQFEQMMTGAFLQAAEALFQQYDENFQAFTAQNFGRGTKFKDITTPAVRVEVAFAEGSTSRFEDTETNQADTVHLSFEHRIVLPRPTTGERSAQGNKTLTEKNFVTVMNRDGAATTDEEDNPLTLIQGEPKGATGRLMFFIDAKFAPDTQPFNMRCTIFTLADKPQAVQVFGGNLQKTSGLDVDAGFAKGPLPVAEVFKKSNKGALNIENIVYDNQFYTWTILGRSPNKPRRHVDEQFYLRLKDITSSNVETPFLTEGHSATERNNLENTAPSSIIGILDVKNKAKGRVGKLKQVTSSDAGSANGYFMYTNQTHIDKVKAQILDETGRSLLPAGADLRDLGKVPFDLMLRFDILRHPEHEKGGNSQVESQTTASKPYRFTVPGEIRSEETFKSQRIV